MSGIAALRLPLPLACAAAALAALPLGAKAQDAAALLRPVADALGLERVAALRMGASGSEYEPITDGEGARAAAASAAARPADARPSAAAANAPSSPAKADDPLYVPPPPPPSRRHHRIARESWAVDLGTATLAIERERAAGSGGAPQGSSASTWTIAPDASWSERHRYWLTPHGFVRGALASAAEVSTGTIDGKPHRIVSFTPERGAEVRGWIDADDRLVRLQTTIDDGRGTPVTVEASLLHWESLGGIEFPTTWIRRENGELAEVLIVREIDVRARD